MTTSDLDARYGRGAARSTRTRLIAVVAGAGVALVILAWVVWAGLLQPGASFEAKDVGFVAHSDAEVEVRWQLATDPGTEVSCAIKAVSEKHAIVGWRVLDLPPSDTHTRMLSETLRTSEPAVGGLLYKCWLT